MAKPLPTIERLRELLNYDPETGILTWKVHRNNRAQAGSVAGSVNRYGYIELRVDYATLRSHRVAWAIHHGKWPNLMVDHIDGVKTNNQIKNLRDVTNSKNQQNRRVWSNKKTGLLGAIKNMKGCSFQARINLEGKYKYLGNYKTAEEAHAAYLAAKKIYHPESFLAQQQP